MCTTIAMYVKISGLCLFLAGQFCIAQPEDLACVSIIGHERVECIVLPLARAAPMYWKYCTVPDELPGLFRIIG